LRLVRALQPEFDCFFDHFFRVLRRFALTDDADGLVSRRIDLFRCAVSALAEVEFLFEIFAQFYGCVKAASYFAAESFERTNAALCENFLNFSDLNYPASHCFPTNQSTRPVVKGLAIFDVRAS